MISGRIDQTDDHQIRGWALNRSTPSRRLLLDLFVGGRFVGEVLADNRRDDLADAGIGDGFSGFVWRDVVAAGTTDLADPIAVAPQLGRRWRPRFGPPAAIREAWFPNVTSYLTATVGKIAPIASETPLGERSEISGAAWTGLLAADPMERRPLCLGRPISAYQAHVIRRYGRETAFDPGFSISEYRRALGWYLDTYSRSRPSMRIPLTAADIAFLDGDADGLLGTHFRPESTDRDVDRRIWDAAAAGLDDCLSPASLGTVGVADLSTGLADRRPGLRRWLDRHPILRVVPTGSAEEVRAACVMAMLFAPVAPHLLGLFEPGVVDRLTVPMADGVCDFDRLARRWLADAAIDAGVWRRRIAAAGFDLAAGRFGSRTAAGDRLEAARRPHRGPAVDVQIVGPFSKALGVGSSCRTLAAALTRTGYEVRCCDFTIDYPNRSLERIDFSLEPFGPARLNVLHLNLEEIPKAFAYLPDVFSDALTVACPYTELSGLAPEYELGCDLVDRVWAATSHIASVIGDRRPVDLIGGAVDLPPPRDRDADRRRFFGERIGAETFVVLTSFDALSGLHRKNPPGVVRAFEAAFATEPDTRLVIKTHGGERSVNTAERTLWASIREIAAHDDRVLIVDDHLDRDDYFGLLGAADLFASLHRAEGFGLNVLEAMALGVPCLVTDYSGTRDFCNAANAFPVGFELVPIRPAEYPFTRGEQWWADPDLDAAIAALRRAAADPAGRRRIGEAARRDIRRDFSLGAFATRLAGLLGDLLGPATDTGAASRQGSETRAR